LKSTPKDRCNEELIYFLLPPFDAKRPWSN
jgi:hypothetical protein